MFMAYVSKAMHTARNIEKKNSLTTPKDVSKRFSSSNNKVIIELKIVSTIVSIATTLLTVCVGVFLLSK